MPILKGDHTYPFLGINLLQITYTSKLDARDNCNPFSERLIGSSSATVFPVALGPAENPQGDGFVISIISPSPSKTYESWQLIIRRREAEDLIHQLQMYLDNTPAPPRENIFTNGENS